ncbi:MAG: hypothetical protein R2813_00115 [Flavobacteriales bacterium]
MQALTVLMRDTFAVSGLIACLFYLNREIAMLICLLIPFVFLMLQVTAGQQNRYPDAAMQNAGPDKTDWPAVCIVVLRIFAIFNYLADSNRSASTSIVMHNPF